MERTLVIIKPDGVRRKLIGEIIKRMEQKNLTISNIKVTTLKRETVIEHYAHISHIPAFNDIVNFMVSSPCIPMIVEGNNAVQAVRNLIGKTNPLEAMPGTIRGDFADTISENLVHASDSAENAQIEIKRFFPEI